MDAEVQIDCEITDWPARRLGGPSPARFFTAHIAAVSRDEYNEAVVQLSNGNRYSLRGRKFEEVQYLTKHCRYFDALAYIYI